MISNPDAVRKILKRKMREYSDAGQEPEADNIQKILDAGVEKVASTSSVRIFNPHLGSGRKLRLVDRPRTKMERQVNECPRELGGMTLKEMLEKAAVDPAFAAELNHRIRKPGNVSKVRHALAGLAAAKEPTLNASRRSIEDGLRYRETDINNRVPKNRREFFLIVKPASLAAARAETGAASWVERKWDVYSLKYAPGYIIVTDKGAESRIFPSRGELMSAINRSGWSIIR